ncbi:MAG: hypothetical protein FWD92_04260 [Methanomassiliicoccaceae archaeon]|nr:hypothetical protein [Methanomassiliicoccaceae archaeon]
MLKKNAALIVTISIFAMILLGQTLAYFAVPYKYDASADITDTGVGYTVSTNSSISYTVLAYDNSRPVNVLYIYYDENYATFRITHETQQKFILNLIVELRIRGFTDVNIVNAKELSDIVSSPYVKGDAILITSGVLPSTVYQGQTNEGIFKWVSEGGSLYWAGYAIGALYADGKDIVNVPAFQQNIFGMPDSILMRAAVSTERSGEELSKALMLSYNNVTYGLNVSKIPGALSLGFEFENERGVFSSISLVEYGDGMISVMGRTNTESSTAVAQMIATGVSPTSSLIGMDGGSLVRGTDAGTISWTDGENIVGVQIRMGDPTVVYARTFFSP